MNNNTAFKTNQKINRVFGDFSKVGYSSLKSNKPPPAKNGDILTDPPILGIQCSVLVDWLSNEEPNKLILIDLRNQSDYQQSHICSHLSLNLPHELTTVQKSNDYSGLLTTKQDQAVFAKRFDVEYVILMDYCDRTEPLVTVATALTRYSSRDISAKMGYLVGGFLDLADQYSHICTSPLRSAFNSSLYQTKQIREDSVFNLTNIVYAGDNKAAEYSSRECSRMRKSFRKLFSKSSEPTKDRKPPSDDNGKSLECIGMKAGDNGKSLECIGMKAGDNGKSMKAGDNGKSLECIGMKAGDNGKSLECIGMKAGDNGKSIKAGDNGKSLECIGMKAGDMNRTNCVLRNIGNTCFMNAVVQCLRSVGRLSVYFISGKYKKDINKGNKLGYKGVLAEMYYTLLVNMDNNTEMSLGELRDFTAQHSLSYSKGEQHDAHEFLNFILDALHEDLNRGLGVGTVRDSSKAESAWRDHLANNQSVICECFQGLLKSTVCCLTCHTESVTFDVFMFLALPIPSTPDCSLEDCLDEFYLVEQLSGIYCQKCQGQRDANKHVGISRFPPTLILFFMRFLYSNGTSRRKDTFVSFPITHFPCPRPHYSLLAVLVCPHSSLV